jgi:outer membrane protein TolC
MVCIRASAQKSITSFDEFVDYATAKSLTLKNGEIQYSQAKNARLAALLGTLDPTGSVSGKYTNNTQLPVSVFPSELLGGQAGTYQEVRLGIQHQTDFNVYVDVKLINLPGWENLKLSKINIHLTSAQNKLTLKNLHEDMATIYFNILTLQEQLLSTELNVFSADTLYQSTVVKYQQGLAKQQDVNDGKVNRLNQEESLRQVKHQITQQYLALKVLCDIPETEEFKIQQSTNRDEAMANPTVEANSLLLTHAVYKEQFARSEYRKSKFAYAPTFSLFVSDLRQQYNTQSTLFDDNVNWIRSNFIGVKLSIPLPSSQSIGQSSRAKSDYMMAKNNTEQARIKSAISATQLRDDLANAFQQRTANVEMYTLRKDSYQKNLLNYRSGVGRLDQTINSFNAMVNSHYQLIASTIHLLLVESKININNKLK